jgi:hypothetical protein
MRIPGEYMPGSRSSSSKGRKPARAPSKKTKKAAKKPTNLSLDPEAVARGERFAERHGTSLSRVVNRFLLSLPEINESELLAQLTPTVRRFYGVAEGSSADRETYRAHLRKKYGQE